MEDLLFYDGRCGLCHRAVVFTLKHDAAGRFAFAPLQGETLRRRLTAAQAAALPDSLVLLSEGEVHVKSRAVARLLAGLGGLWPLLGRFVAAFPPATADEAYDALARVRHRLFAAPAGACPLVPPHLRGRFLP